MLPDALQFAYMRFPHQPLILIQRFHEWIHTSRRLRGRPVLGVASRFAFVIVFLITVHTLDSQAVCSRKRSGLHDVVGGPRDGRWKRRGAP